MALAGLRRAIAAAPRDLRYRNDLLVLLQARGRVNEQVVCLREMCLLWPDLAEPRARLGALLWEAGEHQAAVAAMRRCCRTTAA